RAGMEAPTYVHPELKPALRETFGVIVYHEQVMRTLAAIAGYDLTYADHIRRNLDDESKLPTLRKDFLRRAVQRGVDQETAAKTWDAVAQFASFGFCKAHAAAFAVPTYQSSWLKAHYPAHLTAGLLTHDPGMYPRRLILEDARHHAIQILPLDVNASEREYVVEEVMGALMSVGPSPELLGRPFGPPRRRSGETLPPSALRRTSSGTFGVRLALQDVHGITDAEIRSILVARSDRPLTDVGDLLRRTTVSRPVTEALAHAGAFDSLNQSRRAHLYDAMTTDAPREGDQLTLTDAAASEHRVRDYSDAEVVRARLEVIGP